MFCSGCGKPLNNEDKFCSGCGKVVVREVATPQMMQTPVQPEAPVKEKKVRSQYKTMLFKSILGAIGVCALLEIILILTGEMWSLHAKVLSSIWWVIVFGYMGNVAISFYERTEDKNLGVMAICLVAVNFVVTTLLTWEIINTDSEFIQKLVTTLWISLVCVTHILILSLINFSSDIARKVFNATSIIITITYALILGIVVFEIEHDFYNRICLVFVILTLFGTAATPLINKIYKRL